MPSKYIYALITFMLSISHCWGQEVTTDPVNYLVDHAVFFENGIRGYSENGKYGFQYKNHRITEPVYDTLFKFGKDFCIAKQDTIYFLLDRNLQSRFYQPVRSIEKRYDPKTSTFVVNTRSIKGFSCEYTTSNTDDWDLKSTPYLLRRYDTHDYKTDSIDHADLFPEATSQIHGLMYATYGPEEPYWKILYAEGQVKFFPVNGKAFMRNRPGMIAENYHGESLVEYRDYATNKKMIINEHTEDTIFPPDPIATYYNYRFYSFFEDGQLYVCKINTADDGSTDRIAVYDTKGQLLHTATPGSRRKVKNRFHIDPSFHIIEETIRAESWRKSYDVYTIYSLIDGSTLLENVILYEQSGNYRLYYSPDEKQFFLVHTGRVLYSFPMKKGIYVMMDAFADDRSSSNQLIALRWSTYKEETKESMLLSSSGKILDTAKEGAFLMKSSVDREVIEVLKQTKSAGVQLAIYVPETDQLHWVPLRKPERDVRVFTSNVVLYSGSDGEQSFETCNGDSILELAKAAISVTELNANHFFIVTYTGSKSALYDDDFKQICDNCTIRPVNENYFIFALFRDPESDLFELVDASMKPISNQRYRAALGQAGKLIAALTEANEIEYLMVGE